MNNQEIVYELKKRGISQVDIARHFGTYPSYVNYVINNFYKKSDLCQKIRNYISSQLNLPIEVLWPN